MNIVVTIHSFNFLAFANDATFECCVIPIFLVVATIIYSIYALSNQSNEEKLALDKARREGDRLNEERIRQETERAIANESEYRAWQIKKEQFQESPEYKLIEQFAKKFGNATNKGEVTKLESLLATRGWTFTDSQINDLVIIESQHQLRLRAKSKLLQMSSTDLSELIRNYLSLHSADDPEMLAVFGEVLTELGHFSHFDSDLGVLRLHLASRKKEIELEIFERRLAAEEDLIISIEAVDKLGGYEFEAFLIDLFIRMGYSVEQTKLSGDQGADVVVVKFGEKSVIQAKRFQGNVGNSAIQEIMAAISLYQAQKGMVVTNSYYTKSAKELASANSIELIDRDGLEELINKHW